MISLPRHDLPETLFCGVRVWHSPLALWAIEHVLAALKPARIVELGSGYGGVTLQLGTWASINGAHVLSLDITGSMSEELLARLKTLPVCLEHRDIYADDTVEFIRLMISDEEAGPVLLYCDGGNKMQEILTCAPWLQAGSVLGCHDWITEVAPAIVEPFLDAHGYAHYVDPAALRVCNTLQQFWVKE